MNTSASVFVGGNVSPFTVEKRWGSETTFGVSENVALKKVVLLPNTSLSRQVHLLKDEIYAVFAGTGHVELGVHAEIIHLLTEGDALHIPAGVAHRLVAGNEGITVVEASTPQINDIVRLEDAYNRQVNPNFDACSYLKILKMSSIG